MRKLFEILGVIWVGILLQGCANGSSGLGVDDAAISKPNTNKWPLTGTPADALLAGVLGGELGNGLSRKSLKTALETEYRVLETGQTGSPVLWKGSGTTFGTVTPQQVYEVGKSKCRRYEHVITRNITKRSAIGTACQDASGIWKPLS